MPVRPAFNARQASGGEGGLIAHTDSVQGTAHSALAGLQPETVYLPLAVFQPETMYFPPVGLQPETVDLPLAVFQPETMYFPLVGLQPETVYLPLAKLQPGDSIKIPTASHAFQVFMIRSDSDHSCIVRAVDW